MEAGMMKRILHKWKRD